MREEDGVDEAIPLKVVRVEVRLKWITVVMTNEVWLWLWRKKFVTVVIGGGSIREWKKKLRKNLGQPSSPLTKVFIKVLKFAF